MIGRGKRREDTTLHADQYPRVMYVQLDFLIRFWRVCTVYSISFSSTQRLGGHIPQGLGAHNKSKTQTTQSLTRFIPSLSSAFNQKYSRRPGNFIIFSAWSRAYISFTFLAHSTHLPRDLTLFGRSVAHFPPRPTIHRRSATSTQTIV